MASQRLSLENQNGLEEIQEEQQTINRCHSLESCCLSEADATSGYSSVYEESIFGSVQERRTKQCKNDRGEDIPPFLANTAVTETDATEISSYLGKYWRPLGRNLNIPEATLENISADDKSYHSIDDKAHALLIKFIRLNGCDATKGRLAEALVKIGRRDIAEKLIGAEHFVKKTPDQQIFFLKEEGSFNVPNGDGQDSRFLTCRNIENGRLYLLRELVGTGYEESCKVLKEQDTVADSLLKALDVNGIVRAEKQKKENQKFKEAQNRIMELVKGLKEIVSSLENQERNVERMRVSQQLLEHEKLLSKMQSLATSLLHLTGFVSHLEDPSPIETQMYSFSLGLGATLKDLEGGIRMLKEMIPSDSKAPGQEPEKLLKRIQVMGKEIKMREKMFDKHFKNHDTLEDQKRPRYGQCFASSEPPPRTNRCPEDVPGIRRASTQPVSEEELQTLRKQVAPPADPMEKEDEDVFL